MQRGIAIGVVRRAAVLAAVTVLCLPAVAAADTGDIIAPQNNPPTAADGWQAGTCKTDLPECTPETESQFYTQAAGHPDVGLTQFIVKNKPFELIPGVPIPGTQNPVGTLKTLRVELPVGLSVNPQATPRCELASFQAEQCAVSAPGSQVGTSAVTAALEGLPAPALDGLTKVPVYNLVPKEGQPARFGFRILSSEVFLEADVDWSGDYHEGFTIAVPKSPVGEILKNRLVFQGRAGNGTFLTLPSTCYDPTQAGFGDVYSTLLRADSVEQPNPNFPSGSSFFKAGLPPGVKPTGCDKVPFQPTTAVNPGTDQVDSPGGPAIEVKVPFVESGTAIANSNVEDAVVTLPRGMGLNPAAAPALQMCTNDQFGKGTRNPIGCPAGSKIGTASIETPPLPAGSLAGSLYLGQQLSRDPQSGNVYRVFFDAASTRYGVDVRLIGNVRADPQTGQLTAIFPDSPQVPFTTAKVSLDAGKGLLTSPPTCGPNAATHAMTAWSGSPDQGPKEGGFTLAKLPGGGACPKTMAERPFAPGFNARPKSDVAKTFTPFSANITRPQGQQELKGLDLVLPEGATAKLKGVPYCSAEEIEKTESRSGAAEKKNPTCPKESKVGVTTVRAGTGTKPLEIDGDVYLAGRYKGAPLSMVVVTPALAGPFDLGNVVVRVPFFLDSETAQIHPRTSAIPDVYGGAKLDIRSVFLNVNRDEFTLNGTNCRKGATSGAINGGGANPLDPGTYSAFKVADEFQATGCKPLKFRPKLKIRLFGKTQRAKHPKLRAVLKARGKDANIRKTSVALPHALFLDQASLAKVCTRVQFAAENCPKKSIYGKARAFTPLLGKPLEGPVYLRSSNNTLPDMVAHLAGQVDIDLVGRIDSFKGGIRTTFGRVPDVPVTKFVLTLPGGKKGLLVNSRSLCAKPVRAIIKIKAQNGRKRNSKPKLRTPCNGKKKHSKKHG
ncbi:MAG TPA: hypothetical protein VHP56_12990 [Solirubrobacterales bacterium]|jgi:hypothetical protein|nr:hypothetical protein [Solirubrobacterales bacterium]